MYVVSPHFLSLRIPLLKYCCEYMCPPTNTNPPPDIPTSTAAPYNLFFTHLPAPPVLKLLTNLTTFLGTR